MQRFTGRLASVIAFGVGVMLTAAAANASYLSTVLADNPIGYWRFDEISGSVAQNKIAGGATGIYEGSTASSYTLTLGATGALTASGDSDTAYYQSGPAHTLIPESVFTVNGSKIGSNGAVSMEVWFNTSSLSRQDILNYKNNGDFGLIYWGGSSTSALTLGLYNGSKSATVAVTTNTWYDCVITRDSSHNLSLYVNGQLVTSYYDATSFGNVGFSLIVGSNHSGSTTDDFQSPVSGSIDDLSIYSTALSASQVAAHYAAALSVPEPGTAAILLGGGAVAILTVVWRRRSRREAEIVPMGKK